MINTLVILFFVLFIGAIFLEIVTSILERKMKKKQEDKRDWYCEKDKY